MHGGGARKRDGSTTTTKVKDTAANLETGPANRVAVGTAGDTTRSAIRAEHGGPNTAKTQWGKGPPTWLKESMEQSMIKEQEEAQRPDYKEETEDFPMDEEEKPMTIPSEQLQVLTALLAQLSRLANLPGMQQVLQTIQDTVRAVIPEDPNEEKTNNF